MIQPQLFSSGPAMLIVDAPTSLSPVMEDRRSASHPSSPLKPFEDALGAIFPSDHQNNQFQQAKRIMGGELIDISDEDLGIHLTELQYLLDSWLDDFERQAFAGKTLKQLMRGE
jgi:hypothetical protein